MKNYVISTRISAFLTCISLVAALILHYELSGEEAKFWCNVCLAVFGSALLTLITSCVGYLVEKQRTLESFNYSTRALLHIINKYDLNWSLERKMDFFLDYSDVDKSVWDAHLGAIYFLFDPGKITFKYIYQKIYKPISDINQIIASHIYHFKWHKNGSGKNDVVMRGFVTEIESLFMEEISSQPFFEDGETVQTKMVRNKLVYTALEELNGKYYEIMYSKIYSEREDS